MKIAIISPGTLPIPAIKGGAVEILIDEINKYDNSDLEIVNYSIYDNDIDKDNGNIYIKIPKYIKVFDKFNYFILSKVFHIKKAYSYRFFLQRIYYVKKVSCSLKKKTYDCIVIENSTPLFLALKFHKNYIKYQGKYFYHLHNEIGNLCGCKKIIEKTEKIICVSEYIKQTVEHKFPNYPINNIVILKNAVSNEIKITGSDPFKSFRNNSKIILFVGRLTYDKGIMHLIKAIKKIKNRDYKLVIVGSTFFNSKTNSSFEKELEKESSSIKDRIIFTGYVPHTLLGDYYAKSDFCVFPSIWNEPAGLTMIESIHCGTPIITTSKGGIKEYIKPDTSIILDYKSDDDFIESLYENIMLLLDNQDLLNNMRNMCKNEKISIEYGKSFFYEITGDECGK